jgi:hypothetical protein
MKLAEILSESKIVSVPDFQTSEEMKQFLNSLNGSDRVNDYVVDPETGEVYLEKGKSKTKTIGKANNQRNADLRPPVDDFRDTYHMVTTDVETLTGLERDDFIDVDPELEFPYIFSRKDGGDIIEDDIWEIEEFIDSEYGWAENEGFKLHISKRGQRRAQVSVEITR